MKVNSISYLLVCVFFAFSCKKTNKESVSTASTAYHQLSGEVIGTYYAMKYEGEDGLRMEVDSLFEALNISLSTYVSEATISKFNQADDTYTYSSNEDIHFEAVWLEAKRIHQLSQGDFDPTVGPLVNFYGFGYTGKEKVEALSKHAIDSILSLVGFDKMTLERKDDIVTLKKSVKGSELDFSAIAKGYYVDQLAQFLESKGISNYLVDIGGESNAKGVNDKGSVWVVGINKPKEESAYTDLELALKLDNMAVASSGNYRNYYVNKAGEKFVHTIDPKSGLTKESGLLSTTILAPNCMLADAIATTCMVKGLESALEFIETQSDLEACFIIEDASGNLVHKYSSGFENYVLPI